MLRFDDYLGVAKFWSDVTLQWMETSAQFFTSILRSFEQNKAVFSPAAGSPWQEANPGSQTPTTSWYKPPACSPFEPDWLGLGWVTQLDASKLTPKEVLGPFNPVEAWTKAMELMVPSMTVGLPVPATTQLRPANWQVAAMPWMIGLGIAMVAPAPTAAAPAEKAQFSAYRSESGHAVAQVTFPNQVVAAVAVPENAVSMLDAFFRWPRIVH